jgi:phosphoglycerate kinase
LLLLLLLSCLDLPDIFFLIILQKIVWIGPVKFSNTNQHTNGASKLAQMFDLLSQNNCDVTVVGNMACKVIMQESSSVSDFNMLENGSVAWEFLKGRKLPGAMALDRVSFI